MGHAVLYLCLALTPLALYLGPAMPVVLSLLSSKSHLELSISPNHLRNRHIILIMFLLFFKRAFRAVRLVPSLEKAQTDLKNGEPTQQSSPAAAFMLPNLSIFMPLNINAADIRKYQKAVKPEAGGIKVAGGSLVFLLAPVTEPLMLLLLARRVCPILPLGSVNVKNRFEFVEPQISRQAALGLLQNARVEGQLVQEGRRVKRGVEVDILIEVVIHKDDVRRVVFRKIVTILQFLGSSFEPLYIGLKQGKQSTIQVPGEVSSLKTMGSLFIEASAPMKWAAICKDYNPIHISTWAARTLGYAGRIAHGNLAVAQAVDKLLNGDNQSQDLERIWQTTSRGFWLEAAFWRPIVLPAQLEIQTFSDEAAVRFQLLRGSKINIDGVSGYL